MTHFIPHLSRLSKTIFALITVFILVSCNESKTQNPFRTYPKVEIELPSKTKVNIYVAVDPKRQQLGLSGVRPSELNNNDTMLFTGNHYQVRQFWMPETYMNLDIIFLDSELNIVDIHRNVPHYPKKVTYENKDEVPVSKKVYCQHVLEIKTSSPLAKEFKIGMQLKLSQQNQKEDLKQTLAKIISNTHL